jgi:thymidine phosphorylase
LAKKAANLESAYKLAAEILNSGEALEKFMAFCDYQGPSRPDLLPVPAFKKTVESNQAGTLISIDTEKLGLSLVELGAGRKKTTDLVDTSGGLEMLVRLGEQIERGQPLLQVFGKSQILVEEAAKMASSAFVISSQGTPKLLPLVAKVIT